MSFEPFEGAMDDGTLIQDDAVHRLLQNPKVKSLLDKLHSKDTALVLIEMLDTMERAVGRDLITAEQHQLIECQAAMKVVVGLNKRLKRLLELKSAVIDQQERNLKQDLGKKKNKDGHW